MIRDEASARAWVRELDGCDALAMDRLESLADLLTDENTRQNLVSSNSLAEVWRRHIADSAQLLIHAPATAGTWLDLGTGAGFPGLVIAILRPGTRVTMVECRPRRADWLQRACERLQLTNTVVVESRIERMPAGHFGVISARALASLGDMVAMAARFSTEDTVWVLPKGRSAQHELAQLRGWDHMFHVEQSFTDESAGIIVGRLLGRASASTKDKAN